MCHAALQLGKRRDERHIFMGCPKQVSIRYDFVDFVCQTEGAIVALCVSNSTRIRFRAHMSSTCKEVVRAVEADFVRWSAFV